MRLMLARNTRLHIIATANPKQIIKGMRNIMSINNNDNLQELLVKNKVADSYQYYINCKRLIGHLKYHYETLRKIVSRCESVNNSIYERIQIDWTPEEVTEFCRNERKKNYRMSINGEEANAEYEIQGRFMLIIGMMQSLLDSYAKWINTCLFAGIGYDNKDCNIPNLCNTINSNRDSLGFCKEFLESSVFSIKKSAEYYYINSLNNIIKHQSIITIESYKSVDGTWRKGIPKFKKRAQGKDYVYEAKNMLAKTEECMNYFCGLFFDSVEFVRDFYQTNTNPFTFGRTHEVGLFRTCDGRDYYFIPESEVNKKGSTFLLFEDDNYRVHNCYVKEIMVTEDGNPDVIVGKLVAQKDKAHRLQFKEITEMQIEVLDMKLNDFEIRYIPYEWNKNTDLSSECLGAISLDIKRIIYKQL